jgi:chromosome segregation ATPase
MAAKLKDSEGKIAEKDKEIEELTKQIEELENTADAILAAGANAQTELNNIKNPSTQKKDNGKHNNPNNDNPPGDNDMLNNIRGVGE